MTAAINHRLIRSLLWVTLFWSHKSVVVVKASNRTVQTLNGLSIDHEEISRPIVGLIHGSGTLGLDQLSFSVPHTLQSSLYIDVVVSTLPEYDGVDWVKYTSNNNNDNEEEELSKLGIGARGESTRTYHSCCTEQATVEGACQEVDRGRMIISKESRLAMRMVVEIPENGVVNQASNLTKWRSSARFHYTTQAALVIGNCQMADSTTVFTNNPLSVTGDLVWLSNSTLQEAVFPLFAVLAHFLLFAWYKYHMHKHQGTRIQIETWIYQVLALAFGAHLLQFTYITLEALANQEQIWLRIPADLATKASQTISRCLYVVIAMGLGIDKTKLSKLAKASIVVMGVLILITKETADGMGDIAFLKRDNQWKDNFNQERHNLLKLGFRLNEVFLVWIPLCLLLTTRRLRYSSLASNNDNNNNNDHHNEPQQSQKKLQRFRWMWGIYLFVAILFISFRVFMRHGGWHKLNWAKMGDIYAVLYFLILACMTILWKPHENAPMYGYVLMSDNNNDHDHDNFPAAANNNNNNNHLQQQQNESYELVGLTSSPLSDHLNIKSAMIQGHVEVHHDLSLRVESP